MYKRQYEAWTFLKTPPSTPGQEAFFDVEPGASVRRVADKLEERGLITDARKFLLLARYKKWDSRLQAGRFALNTGWLPEDVYKRQVIYVRINFLYSETLSR